MFFLLYHSSSDSFLAYSFGNSHERLTDTKHARAREREESSFAPEIIIIMVVGIIVLLLQIFLVRFWIADKHYALGYNLDKSAPLFQSDPQRLYQSFIQANEELTRATEIRPGEDLYKDELSVNFATLALAFAQQNRATEAASLMQQAKSLSDEVVNNHPNNVVYYKSRTRVLYSLSQIDSRYFQETLDSIETAHRLAPTDAKVVYNMALLYDQGGKRDHAIELMQQSISLKPNYRDPRYALALYYSEMAKAEQNKDPEKAAALKKNAISTLEYILQHIDPADAQVKDLLKSIQ